MDQWTESDARHFDDESAVSNASTPPITCPPIPSFSTGGPVTSRDRIVSIDVLRGFALLGILLLNIQSFSMIGAAYFNPTAYGDLSGANYWVWYLSRLFGDQKFMTIFSMLFGAGIVLMSSRAEQKTGHSAGVHYRRMVWLILFGLLHAHLLWYGDILYSYGMCGLLVYLLRSIRSKWLVVLGFLSILASSAISLAFYQLFQILSEEAQQNWMQGQLESWAPTQEIIQTELDAYRGGWLDQAPSRSIMAGFFQTFIFVIFIMWRVVGLMLIGMALYKWGVFSAARSTKFYIIMAVVGLAFGFAGTVTEVQLHETHNWPVMESMYLYGLIHQWAVIPHSLGYAAIIMLMCKTGVFTFLQFALAAVGRMALSNYLLQTIICTMIYYGHGFGQFGYHSRVEQLGIFALLTMAQLIWSPIWLRYFRFGPFEWLWRTLTYWKLQPMRRLPDTI